MLDWLTDPLGSPIVVRGIAEVLILSLACGPLGVWVLLYRDAYAAESISHGMLPGLVIAALAGVPLLFGAFAGVLVATHDVRQAGEWDRVLCLHGRQIDFGRPVAVLSPETLRETYGAELIVLEGGDHAVGVGHHVH